MNNPFEVPKKGKKKKKKKKDWLIIFFSLLYEITSLV
jgi:hypothetical protein